MTRFSRACAILLLLSPFFITLVATLHAQKASDDRIFFHGKIFTADPENPYADSVAIRGDKIIAVGTYQEV